MYTDWKTCPSERLRTKNTEATFVSLKKKQHRKLRCRFSGTAIRESEARSVFFYRNCRFRFITLCHIQPCTAQLVKKLLHEEVLACRMCPPQAFPTPFKVLHKIPNQYIKPVYQNKLSNQDIKAVLKQYLEATYCNTIAN